MVSKRLRVWAWVFLAPALIIYTVFWMMALLAGLSLSTVHWSGYGNITFVWLHNFQALLQDPEFYASLGRNVRYGVVNTIVGIALGMITALLLDRCRRGQLFYRTAIYLPVVLSWIVIAFVVRWALNPVFGLLNPFLDLVGLGFVKANWLADVQSLFDLIIAVAVWKGYPFATVILFAGLQNISRELKEAAYVDGAGEFACTWHVVLPLLKPVLAVVISLSLIDAFRIFDPVYVLGGSGGGSGTGNPDLDVLTTILYRRAFVQFALGDASALGVILFVLTMAVSVFYLRTLGRSED